MYELTKADIETLVACANHLSMSGDPHFTETIYRSPADQLRHEASCLEKRDADIAAYRALVNRVRAAR